MWVAREEHLAAQVVNASSQAGKDAYAVITCRYAEHSPLGHGLCRLLCPPRAMPDWGWYERKEVGGENRKEVKRLVNQTADRKNRYPVVIKRRD